MMTVIRLNRLGELAPTHEQLFGSEPKTPCGECGMPVVVSQYHPYAACLMFKASKSSAVVEANLAAVLEHANKTTP